jgi:hypothetical protein
LDTTTCKRRRSQIRMARAGGATLMALEADLF